MGKCRIRARTSKRRILHLAEKLNLKHGMRIRVIGKPMGVDLDDVNVTASPEAEGILVFVGTLADVDAKSGPVVRVAREDRIAWIAYPKAGQLGTDLNRDILWKHLLKQRVQGVRQVSIDDVWSALRFRPSR